LRQSCHEESTALGIDTECPLLEEPRTGNAHIKPRASKCILDPVTETPKRDRPLEACLSKPPTTYCHLLLLLNSSASNANAAILGSSVYHAVVHWCFLPACQLQQSPHRSSDISSTCAAPLRDRREPTFGLTELAAVMDGLIQTNNRSNGGRGAAVS
jgi:hypothetical protein